MLLGLAVAVSLYLSKDQIKKLCETAFGKPAKVPVKTKSEKLSYGSNEPLPKASPLNITPEQVKNYDDRPWRPFRWPYHQTMSIFRLDINHWLDMDKYYWRYIEEKKRIFHTYGNENVDCLPEGEDAAMELMEIVTDHMLARYPYLFTLLEDKGSNGKIVRNEMTLEVLDMTLPMKQHPLIYVSKMAKEDFYLVKQDPTTKLHYLVAAAVPFPGGSFRVSEKLGKNLDIIHAEVPYYHEKLKKSMERWFERLGPNDPVERASWYITWDHKLRVNNVYQTEENLPAVDPTTVDPKDFVVRVERQTLRRLPKSRAIIFTNHPIFYSLDEMKDEPLVPSLLKKIIYEASEPLIKYKNFTVHRDHIGPYLDECIQAQIDKGLIQADTPVKTLPTYPFAYWADTDFDYVNGWTSPQTNKVNWSEKAKTEKYVGNE